MNILSDLSTLPINLLKFIKYICILLILGYIYNSSISCGEIIIMQTKKTPMVCILDLLEIYHFIHEMQLNLKLS